MKKLSLAFAAVIMLAAVSCKKDYTCECTADVAGIKTTASSTINATKKDATEACEAGNSSSEIGGIKSTVTCVIK